VRSELDPVNYTIWRNHVLLGRVRVAFPVSSPGLIAGMLEVEPAFSDVDEIMQTRLLFPVDSRVFESKMSEAHRGPGPVALRQLTPEEAAGISHERILEVRDENGRALVTDLIAIDRLPPQLMERGELFDICKARGIRIGPWSLTAHVRDTEG
jgi:hypothetical protein